MVKAVTDIFGHTALILLLPPLSNTEFIRLFRKGVTSKKDHASHGFGLYNIRRITERCHGKIITRNEQDGGENHVVFGVLLP